MQTLTPSHLVPFLQQNQCPFTPCHSSCKIFPSHLVSFLMRNQSPFPTLTFLKQIYSHSAFTHCAKSNRFSHLDPPPAKSTQLSHLVCPHAKSIPFTSCVPPNAKYIPLHTFNHSLGKTNHPFTPCVIPHAFYV